MVGPDGWFDQTAPSPLKHKKRSGEEEKQTLPTSRADRRRRRVRVTVGRRGRDATSRRPTGRRHRREDERAERSARDPATIEARRCELLAARVGRALPSPGCQPVGIQQQESVRLLPATRPDPRPGRGGWSRSGRTALRTTATRLSTSPPSLRTASASARFPPSEIRG